MIELDGKEIVRWLVKADPTQLALLIGAEYSDVDDVWDIIGVDTIGLTLKHTDASQSEYRAFGALRLGTFFFTDDAVGNKVRDQVHDARSELDNHISNAKAMVVSHGFSPANFGSDRDILKLATVLRRFYNTREVPNENGWDEVRNLFSQSSNPSLLKSAAALITKWILLMEQKLEGCFDVNKRILLAYLHRHAGQLEEALAASNIVENNREKLVGSDAGLAVLHTIRAAALMDMAEHQQLFRDNHLTDARLNLNKAYRLADGESVEIKNAYRRLDKLAKIAGK